MSTIRKKIVPTLLRGAEPTGSNAFKQAAEKKNPLDAAADLISSRYGVSDENIPQINEEAFKKIERLEKRLFHLKNIFGKARPILKKKKSKTKRLKKTRICITAMREKIKYITKKYRRIH
jgi:hypothetical protein